MDAADVLRPIAKIGGLVRLFGIGLIILGGLSVWARLRVGKRKEKGGRGEAGEEGD